ncbi:MAG TPA: SDR family NAD(P)-dependent oxidoreductase [Anaerolineae bacterium]|jgi:3-oxoacyl-[acyl-carrier protein] reductase
MSTHTLAGKVALVTGAGRGIGRAIALSLAHNGATVALLARTAAQLHTVKAEIEAAGGRAISIVADLTREPDVISAVAETVNKLGHLDIVVNNAGIGAFGPLAEATLEQWESIMAVNARGTFLVCREAIPHLKRHTSAHIINITSVVGVKGYANQSLYSASKHAVMGMTKALARELQADGIRVHAICPGAVDTPMAGEARPDLDRSGLIQPDDIADAVMFLLTMHASAVIDELDIRRAGSTPWA